MRKQASLNKGNNNKCNKYNKRDEYNKLLAHVVLVLMLASVISIILGCKNQDKNNTYSDNEYERNISLQETKQIQEPNVVEPSSVQIGEQKNAQQLNSGALDSLDSEDAAELSEPSKIMIKTSTASIILYAEVAGTEEEHRTGLMFRTKSSFPEDRAMLFIYEKPTLAYYWMKNMTFPIDTMFIDSYNRIVHVYENLEPCEEDEKCKTYPSVYLVKYVLETNAGFIRKNGISINDEVVFIETDSETQN